MADDIDDEVESLRAAYVALSGMSPAARGRAMRWLTQRLGAEENNGRQAAYAVGQFARVIGRKARRWKAAA